MPCALTRQFLSNDCYGALEELASPKRLDDGCLLSPTLAGCVPAVTTRQEIDAFLPAFCSIVTA